VPHRARVADYVASFLKATTPSPVFLLTGGFAMHLNDAVAAHGQLRYICNHHEQASAMSADGWARQSGGLGVVMATGGSGATNLLTGIAEAWVDSIPLLVLTGTGARSQTVRGSGIAGLRQMGFLELDIIPMVASITKYAVSVHDPSTIRFHLEQAAYLATAGRPGPVFLEIPLDVQAAQISPSTLEGFTPPLISSHVDPTDLLNALRKSTRPVLLGGHGIRCARQVEQFRQVVRQLQIPILTTQMAKDLLPYAEPLFTGHPGLRGDRAGNFAVQNCDLLITLGTSLNSQTTGYDLGRFAPQAKRIMVEPDSAQRERTCRLGHHLATDCATFLAAILAAPPEACSHHQPWRSQCAKWKHRFKSQNEPHVLGGPDSPVNLYELYWELNRQSHPETSFLSDSGQTKMAAGQALQLRQGQRYLANGGLGGMGWALPAAIGAALASPGRQIVAFIGDGSLQTNVHELQTLSHHCLNIKIFVINNGGYGSIRATQRQYFPNHPIGADPATGVSLPPLEKLAEAYGIPYIPCATRASLSDSVTETLRHHGPAICGVESRHDQQIIPFVGSDRRQDGIMFTASLEHMSPTSHASQNFSPTQ
jgi:acetolactate synthase-1/2/3 large subunit